MNTLFVGTSIIELTRIKKSLRNPKFLSRLYSPQELKFLMSRSFSKSLIAEMFCTKIAFAKAMGYSFRECRLSEISVIVDGMNNPMISLSGKTKAQFATKKCNMTASFYHSKDYAVATVIFFNKN